MSSVTDGLVPHGGSVRFSRGSSMTTTTSGRLRFSMVGTVLVGKIEMSIL